MVHLGPLYIAQYITVEVAAQSMGGILIRQAMFDTPYVGVFPPTLWISDVVTAGTPHNGGLVPGAAGLGYFAGCASPCLQVYQMQADNALMQNLNSTTFRYGFGRDPSGGNSGGTDWTTFSSEGDWQVLSNCTRTEWVGSPPWQVGNRGICGFMPGATHFVDYIGPSPWYDHGGYLGDNSTAWDANVVYSDNNGGNYVTTSGMIHASYEMYEAILYSSW